MKDGNRIYLLLHSLRLYHVPDLLQAHRRAMEPSTATEVLQSGDIQRLWPLQCRLVAIVSNIQGPILKFLASSMQHIYRYLLRHAAGPSDLEFTAAAPSQAVPDCHPEWGLLVRGGLPFVT